MYMSVTRALAELKRIDDRIATAISTSKFIDVSLGKGTNQKLISGEPVDKQRAKLQSNKDTLTSLFSKRAEIKAAIVASNAETIVVVNGTAYTVAEAIELKRSIESKRQLSRVLKQQAASVSQAVIASNDKLNTEIEANMTAIYGSDKSKVDPSAYDSVSIPKKNQKEAEAFDPINVSDWVEKLDEEISQLDTELDFLLSESNAKTEVYISD